MVTIGAITVHRAAFASTSIFRTRSGGAVVAISTVRIHGALSIDSAVSRTGASRFVAVIAICTITVDDTAFPGTSIFGTSARGAIEAVGTIRIDRTLGINATVSRANACRFIAVIAFCTIRIDDAAFTGSGIFNAGRRGAVEPISAVGIHCAIGIDAAIGSARAGSFITVQAISTITVNGAFRSPKPINYTGTGGTVQSGGTIAVHSTRIVGNPVTGAQAGHFFAMETGGAIGINGAKVAILAVRHTGIGGTM